MKRSSSAARSPPDHPRHPSATQRSSSPAAKSSPSVLRRNCARCPDAAALDAAIPDQPVWLTRVDGHAGVANSAARKLAGVTASPADPDGGHIVRGSNGAPAGVFVDQAMDLVERAIPEPSY